METPRPTPSTRSRSAAWRNRRADCRSARLKIHMMMRLTQRGRVAGNLPSERLIPIRCSSRMTPQRRRAYHSWKRLDINSASKGARPILSNRSSRTTRRKILYPSLIWLQYREWGPGPSRRFCPMSSSIAASTRRSSLFSRRPPHRIRHWDAIPVAAVRCCRMRGERARRRLCRMTLARISRRRWLRTAFPISTRTAPTGQLFPTRSPQTIAVSLTRRSCPMNSHRPMLLRGTCEPMSATRARARSTAEPTRPSFRTTVSNHC